MTDWAGARLYCQQHYTDLVNIQNSQELNDLLGFVGDHFWTGLYTVSGEWKSSDGNPVNYTGALSSGSGCVVACFNHKLYELEPCSNNYKPLCYLGKYELTLMLGIILTKTCFNRGFINL